MRPVVLFYSLNGRTCTLARRLAAELDAEVGRIACRRYSGLTGRLRLLIDIVSDRTPTIELPDLDLSPERQIIVGGPIWARRVCGPLRAALGGGLHGCHNLMLYVTYRGADNVFVAETAIAEARLLVASPLQAYAAVSDLELQPHAIDATARRLARLFGQG